MRVWVLGAAVLALSMCGCAWRSAPRSPAPEAARLRPHGPGLGAGQTCGGVAGLQCQSGLYCAYPPRSCHFSDAEGTCTPKPASCPARSEPVCGCDGKTYDSTCLAAQAGVSPISARVCPDKSRWSWF